MTREDSLKCLTRRLLDSFEVQTLVWCAVASIPFTAFYFTLEYFLKR